MKSTKKLPLSVIPAQAGIQVPPQIDSRLRGNDGGLRNSSRAVLDSSDFAISKNPEEDGVLCVTRINGIFFSHSRP
jgi:hypothetical protein